MTRRRSTFRRTGLVAAALGLMAVGLVGCGSNAPDVDPALASSPADAMSLKHVDGATWATGHGVAIKLAQGWTDYAPEKRSFDGTTFEWAAGMPDTTRPLPYGLQSSMGMKNKGAGFAGLPQGTKSLAELAPGYKLLDEGDAKVPGAKRSYFLRFERDMKFGGKNVHVEQAMLFLEMPQGETSTLRFISEAGKFEQQLGAVYGSVVVAETSDSA